MKYKNILLTACNDAYYTACLTLISHTQQLPVFQHIDQIIVYNLGMTEKEIDYLNKLEKVTVKFFGKDTKEFFPGYLDPKTYAWKMYVLHDAKNLATNCIFYLDSGVVPVFDFTEVYDKIEETGKFLVGSLHKIGEHISDACKIKMNVTENELKAEAITAGIQGYKIGSYYECQYIDVGFYLSQIPECICGNKYGENPHRHDQTIYSILANRLKITKFEDLYKYSGWLNPHMIPEQIFWVHRRNYINFERLKFQT